MQTVAQAERAATAEARRALDAIDPEFLQLRGSAPMDGRRTAGELLVAATLGPIATAPEVAIRQLRKKTGGRLKSAVRHFEHAEAVATWLASAADYLERGTALPSPPEGVPDHIADNVRALVVFNRSGLADAQALASKLRAAVRHGSAELAAARKAFRRFPSAANVALHKRAADHAESANRPHMANGLRRRADAAAERHRSLFGTAIHKERRIAR